MARERRLRARRVRLFSETSFSVSFVESSYFRWVSTSSAEMSSYMALYVSWTLLACLALFAFRLATQAMAAPMPPEGIAHWSICIIVSIAWVAFRVVLNIAFYLDYCLMPISRSQAGTSKLGQALPGFSSW